MAWSHIGQIGTAGNATGNQTGIVVTTSADAEVGNLLILLVGKDNSTTPGGPNSQEVVSVVDSAGNYWFNVLTFANTSTAQTATACSMWYTQVTTALAATGTITATFGTASTSNDAQAAIVQEFTLTSGAFAVPIAHAGLETDAGDPGAISLASLTSAEYLFVHGLSCEGESTDAYTWDTDYTQFTVAGGNSGVAGTSQHITGGFRVATATGDTVDVTSDTADRDYAQVLAAFREIAPGAGASGGPVQLVNSGGLVG